MIEHFDAVARFEDDLTAAGVPHAAAHDAGSTYQAALAAQRHIDWTRFYLSVFAALRAIAIVPPAGAQAVRRLTALVDDDFGVTLIALDDRRRLRLRLVEAA